MKFCIRLLVISQVLAFFGCGVDRLSSSEQSALDDQLAKYEVSAHDIEALLQTDRDSEYLNGMHLYLSCNRDNAEELLFRLAKLIGDGVDGPHMRLAEAKMLSELSRDEAAQIAIRKAMNTYGPNPWLLLQLAELSRSEDSTFLFLDSALAINSEFYRAKVAIAYHTNIVTEYGKIINLIEDIDTLPRDTLVLSYLAEAYFFKEDYPNSLRLYQESIKTAPNIRAYVGIGNLYQYTFAELDKAGTYFDLAASLDSADMSVLRSRGWLEFDLKHEGKAQYYFDQLLDKLDNLDEVEMGDLIDFYFLLDDKNKCERILVTMREKYGDDFTTMGYHIIVNRSKSAAAERIIFDQYQARFGDDAAKWFADKLAFFGIDDNSVKPFERQVY